VVDCESEGHLGVFLRLTAWVGLALGALTPVFAGYGPKALVFVAEIQIRRVTHRIRPGYRVTR
jgi:hypothetical protein